MISMTVDGGERIRSVLRGLPAQVQKSALRAGAQAAFDTAQDAADTHTRTGALARSLKLRSIKDGYEVYHNTSTAPYAGYVHWGTRPHRIGPKNKKVLRWAGGSGGATGFVFASSVLHPGYKGDAWMLRARDAAEAGILAAAARAV